ncbi:MAG: prolyl oligopeptidase family serine peptidase [Pseudomonadota bacterium]
MKQHILFLPILVILCVGCSQKEPQTPSSADTFLWLEDIEGKKSLDWVKKQSSETLKTIATGKRFKKLEKQALDILQAKDKIPGVSMKGNHLYNFWQDKKHVRGVWRRTLLKNYKRRKPRWETLLDLDLLAKSEKEDWVFKDARCLSPKYIRCLIKLSRGGKDAVEVREFDLRTKRFVKNGFFLKEAKTDVNWLDKNHIFVATNFGPGSLTESGYARIVKLWKRGTSLDSAKTLYEGEVRDMAANSENLESLDRSVSILTRWKSFFTKEHFVYEQGGIRRLPLPKGAILKGFFRSYYIAELRNPWSVEKSSFQAGSLIAIHKRVVKNQVVKKGDVYELFKKPKNGSILATRLLRDRILVNALENVRGRIYAIKVTREGFTKPRLLSLVKNAHLVLGASSIYKNDFFFQKSSFLTPDALYFYDSIKKKVGRVQSLPAKFNSSNMAVRQHWATSQDGTKVPYFVVGKTSLMNNGPVPTLLYGYGGFQYSQVPGYKPLVGKLWLENGGLYVLANIRGGGEFGPAWHKAVLKKNRHKAYDDFIAVAEDLIQRKYSSPQKLAIRGRSNGGLLVSAVMTRRPDLFRSVLCIVPLTDMIRYSQLLAGASWMEEYGDPRDPSMRDYLLSYSPYQNLKADAKYPEILILTSTKDDRVHPGHARKLAAKMISQGHERVHFYEEMEGGHKGTAYSKQWARWQAMTYEHLYRTLN